MDLLPGLDLPGGDLSAAPAPPGQPLPDERSPGSQPPGSHASARRAPGRATADGGGRTAEPAGQRPARKRPASRDAEISSELPVARVAAMVGFAHLDRPFDYLVPASMAAGAVPGARVRVRFAGRLVDGFVLERLERSDHDGRLAPLAKVISPEPVLSAPVARLARAVADRYAGTLADVLRLAIPPRHAAAERAATVPTATSRQPAPSATEAPGSASLEAPTPGVASTEAPTGATSPGVAEPAAAPAPGEPGEWRRYPAGPSLLAALTAGRAPRAVWWAPPGPAWPAMITTAARATLAGGRGVLVVVPDHRDVDRLADVLTADLAAAGAEKPLVAVLRADLGPAERYRRFLAVARGEARVVVGTRAAGFAPVADLGLIVVWDDGDDLHAEPRAPYPHTRDVAALRSHLEDTALLVGGHAPSADAEALTRSGWAHPLVLPRGTVRALAPLVRATGSDWEAARDEAARIARIPSLAARTAREALAAGHPVLVQVPRRGYQPSLACASCRRPARCAHCHGPLGRPAGGRVPVCGWCGRPAPTADTTDAGAAAAVGTARAGKTVGRGPAARSVPGVSWACPACGDTRLRVSVTGDRRTAEELGRAFPGVALRTSGRDEVLAAVSAAPTLVVATPGAEPVAEGGYGAVLLLDGWAMLGRPDLRAGEETLRRWANAAALARPGPSGGRVVVVADEGLAPVQALIRWDPAWFVAREADDRAELGFPPAARIAAVEGTAPTLREFLAAAALPPDAEVLGPVPVASPPRRPAGDPATGQGGPESDGGPRERLLVRVPRKEGAELADALRAAHGVLDARRAAAGLRVQLDPVVLG
ncbi:primosomal protein N' [Frankia sp. AgB1.8]|uniref:primosomal protein N' n=1 Tax=Frankia sp. AgB1.8 TaxID=2792839 RepID=UPI0019344878|nr:primosomal protein N' [Frankia sp. AgB1.8]MBL7619736.1 primosomal protein N' [Frankia sp. AgB1.8]